MYLIKLFMKQVKLIAALLLFVFGASAQTVTPDPGPYTPMNQKYEYRWIKTSGGLWNLGKFVQVDSAQFNGVTYVPSAASNDSTIKAANTGWVRRLFATASGSAGKWDTAGNAGLTDPRLGTTNNSPFAIVTNNIKRLIIPAAGILPATTNAVFLVRDTLNGELKYSTSGGGGDTTGLGNLYIRNTTTQENKRFNVKGGRLDTLYASTSGGGRVVSNGGTIAAEWGAGGGSNFDFHGFAGYNANRASSYTTRSFTDKNYVDSSLTLKTTVSSYGKNATRDSTILLLSNGTRFAAKDSVGGGGSTKAYAPLIVRNDSVFQRFNVLAYGADNTGTTDATVAIQSAINACDAAGGGEVYFPNGTYLIGGAINATYNSQLYIPASSFANRRAFVLMGESTNLLPFGGGLGIGSGTLPPLNGVKLKSTLSTFTNAGQAVIGTVITGINASSLTIKNIGITVKHNPSGTGPVVGGINWSKGTNCRIEDSYAVIDTSGFNSVNPQNDVSGIELPDNSISEFYTLSNTLVGGFFNGYKLGEHAMLNNVAAMVCKNAYFFKQGSHSSTAPRAGAYWCANAIYVQNSVTLASFKLDVEWQNIGKWYDNVYTIKDTANAAKGQVSYTIIAAGIGKDNSKFAKLGGNNLFAISDDNGLAVLSSNTFTSSSALTQTFNQTGSATANLLWQKNGVSRWSLGNDASGTFNDFYLNDLVNSKFKIYANGADGDMSIGANAGATSTAGIYLKNNNDVGFDNNAFYWDATNNRLGINTSTPSSDFTLFKAGDGLIKMQTTSTGTTATDGFHIALENSTQHVYFNNLENSNLYFFVNGAERFRIGSTGSITIPATNTATGTTGARTINLPSGKVNFAAGDLTLVVTNSIVTTASIVQVQVEGTDLTAISARVTPAAGSFTITLNAPATAETKVNFTVIN
jgi:ribosomal protein L27